MYYNNQNRNLTEAYEKTVKEQTIIDLRILREEAGSSTNNLLTQMSNSLVKLKTKVRTYEKSISGANYDIDDNK